MGARPRREPKGYPLYPCRQYLSFFLLFSKAPQAPEKNGHFIQLTEAKTPLKTRFCACCSTLRMLGAGDGGPPDEKPEENWIAPPVTDSEQVKKIKRAL